MNRTAHPLAFSFATLALVVGCSDAPTPRDVDDAVPADEIASVERSTTTPPAGEAPAAEAPAAPAVEAPVETPAEPEAPVADAHEEAPPVGASDALAQAACDAVASLTTAGMFPSNTPSPEPLLLASTTTGAARAILTPQSAPYLVRIPESGTGFATLEIADWHTPVALFGDVFISLTVDRAAVRQATLRDAACPMALTDTRLTIHEWGSYLVTFTGPPGDAVLLVNADEE